LAGQTGQAIRLSLIFFRNPADYLFASRQKVQQTLLDKQKKEMNYNYVAKRVSFLLKLK
jgi:hypothetical protein